MEQVTINVKTLNFFKYVQISNFFAQTLAQDTTSLIPIWEVLMWFDSEAAARVSGAAETVDYFG